MSEMKTTELLKALLKKVKWYDYIGFVVWIVLLYLSLDLSLSMYGEPGGWGGRAGTVALEVFFAILIIGLGLRLGIHYLLKLRRK